MRYIDAEIERLVGALSILDSRVERLTKVAAGERSPRQRILQSLQALAMRRGFDPTAIPAFPGTEGNEQGVDLHQLSHE